METTKQYHRISAVVQASKLGGWLRFSKPLEILQTYDITEVIPIIEKAESRAKEKNQYVVGFIGYESARAFDTSLETLSHGDIPLVWFAVFSCAEDFIFPTGDVQKTTNQNLQWRSKTSNDDYKNAFNQINHYLSTGDVYQVNYTYRLRAEVSNDHWQLFVNMVCAQNLANTEGYCAFIDTPQWAICSASPELFFSLDKEELVSKPMKGTAPRGLSYEDDQDIAQHLKKSIKNRAENIMISDMVRNDMGRIAKVGTVNTTDILALKQYPTFWAMTTTVACQTTENLVSILSALFPAASITGAPKIRASQIIADTETQPRQVYTGAIGYIAPDGYCQFNVAIRTVIVSKKNKTAEFGVGGGIVWDSSADDEFSESLVKARVLTHFQPDVCLLETFLWRPATGYAYLEAHLERLKNSACYFSWEIGIENVKKKLLQQATCFATEDMRVRLLVDEHGHVEIDANELLDLPSPYKIKIANTPINSKNYFFYHKTSNRQIYQTMMSEVSDCDNVILWNEEEQITESCIANIVVEVDGKKMTPPVACGLLNGVYRNHLVQTGEVQESVITKQQLLDAKNIWLVNSVRGMWQVKLEK